jgi:6-phosphogluconolactonase
MRQFPYEVHDPDILTLRAAELLARIATDAVAARGVAHIALSGGSTPRPLFKLLASPEWEERVPWAHTHIWWVDERCVPPDDPNSNYGVAFALLLQHLPVVITHRIRGEESPWEAAYLYEQELVAGFDLWSGAWPRFDLILLGMGTDGHTASLFPGTSALAEREHRVTVGHAPAPPQNRISLTLPVLNHAAHVFFLVAGENKGPALTAIFHEAGGDPPLPASLVQPRDGRLLWLLDAAAQTAADLELLQNC